MLKSGLRIIAGCKGKHYLNWLNGKESNLNIMIKKKKSQIISKTIRIQAIERCGKSERTSLIHNAA